MTTPEFFRYCGILDKWHNKTLVDFTNDKLVASQINQYVKNVKKARELGTGLYMYGLNGVGKSLLLNALMIKLLKMQYKVKIMPMYDLVTLFIKAWRDNDCAHELTRIKSYYDFVGVEEVNKEFRSTMPLQSDTKNEDLVTTALDNIIRERLQRNLPTLFTSNLAPELIGKRYSEDIASMLNEACVIMEVTGKDRRDDIAERNQKLISK